MIRNQIILFTFLLTLLLCVSCASSTNKKVEDTSELSNSEFTPITFNMIEADYDEYYIRDYFIKTPYDDAPPYEIPEDKVLIVEAGKDRETADGIYSLKVYFSDNETEHIGKIELSLSDKVSEPLIIHSKQFHGIPNTDDGLSYEPFAVRITADDGFTYWLITDTNTTYIFNDNNGIDEEVAGQPYEVDGNKFTIKTIEDIFGDKKVFYNYSISADGYKSEDDGIYRIQHMHIDGGFDVELYDDIFVPYHVVLKQFKATSSKTNKQFTVKKGTKIKFTATNLTDRVYFETENGKKGYFEFEFDMPDKLVFGMPREEVFSNIGCAG